MVHQPSADKRHPPANRFVSRYMMLIAALLVVALMLGIRGMVEGTKCSCPTCQQVRSGASPLAQQHGDGSPDGQAAATDDDAAEGKLQQQHDDAPGETSSIITAVSDDSSSSSGQAKPWADPPKGQDDAYVALCTAVKDEHCDIREWVLHHAELGARKLYVFDTQSAEPMAPVLDDLVASGLVEYSYVTNTSKDIRLKQPSEGRSYNWQVPIFTLCLERYGSRHRWMGFIDADEFVVPTGSDSGGDSSGSGSTPATGSSEGDEESGSSDSSSESGSGSEDDSSSDSPEDSGSSGSSSGGSGSGSGSDRGSPAGALPALLRRYEAHGGLVLHWQLFAFSGHIERPAGGVLASYTSCWPQQNGIHRHVKSFVQPAMVVRPETAHSFVYKGGQSAVDTLGTRVKGPIVRGGPIPYKGALLHHYISKSLADFEVKSVRRGGAGSVKTLAHFLKWHRWSTATCTRAVPLGRALARKYDLSRNVPDKCFRPELPPPPAEPAAAGEPAASRRAKR